MLKRRFHGEDHAVGELEIDLSLGSGRDLIRFLDELDPELWRGDDIHDALSQELSDRFLAAALVLTFDELNLRVEDRGLLDAIFEMAPREAGAPPTQLRQQAMMMAKASPEDSHQAFADFLGGDHGLALSLEARRPIAFAELNTGQFDNTKFDELFDADWDVWPL
ncbi:hypothetical protein [Gallaecimonas sp. GXIMD4217]|uniref:hypothetical protein n=1 Tax=Gallaecimonas sp. GXIMD4217 TaxID=3131927 RepID=UPI00311ABABF